VDGETFSSCASPHTTAPLADGPHTFRVRAIDAVGNVDSSPATKAFSVDTQPPDTAIDSGPTGTTSSRDVKLSFSGVGAERFECSLDGTSFQPCASPVTYSRLPDGEHVFRVRAVDAAGNQDPTPAAGAFAVDRHVDARLERLNRRQRFDGRLRLKASASMFEPGRAVLRARFEVAGGAVSTSTPASFQVAGTRRLVLKAPRSVNRVLAAKLRQGPVDGAFRARFTDRAGNTRLVSRPIRLAP
jgi:hypothetical protein